MPEPSFFVGTPVDHPLHGKGTILRLISGGLAEVRFSTGTRYVETKNLIATAEKQRRERQAKYIADRKRQEEQERAYQEREARQRRSARAQVIERLDANDVEGADRLHGQLCRSWWSAEDYLQCKGQYVEARAAAIRRQELLRQLDDLLANDFLSADDFYHASCSDVLSSVEYQAKKIALVRQWISIHGPRDANGTRVPVDDEQAAAIGSVHGNQLVTARAGSGKTTTLVARAVFLMNHCKVGASEILLLAFNRKAALDIRLQLLKALQPEELSTFETLYRESRAKFRGRRGSNQIEMAGEAIDDVASRLGVELPPAMTFHSLARSIAFSYRQQQGRLEPQLLVDRDHDQSHSQAVQDVIDDHLRSPDFQSEVRNVMLSFFREDWEKIALGGYSQGQDEFLSMRRSLQSESLGGDYVKSTGEKLIANFLFEHDVPYRYEHPHTINGVTYRPDFTVFRSKNEGLVLEYFGLQGVPGYDEMSDRKRQSWSEKRGWDFVDFSPTDIAIGIEAFEGKLTLALQRSGIPYRRLLEEEIWLRVRKRAIDSFTTVIKAFIGRCRKSLLSHSALSLRIDEHARTRPAELPFLRLVNRIYAAYLQRLADTGEEDFDGLLEEAAIALSRGATVFNRKFGNLNLRNLRYLFIDEYQDFSELFYRLIRELRAVNPAVHLFCVGDDWQAINGFAGSDLTYFHRFEEYFGPYQHLSIRTNYRSAKAIVAIGNSVMHGGAQAIAHKQKQGLVTIADLTTFVPSHAESREHGTDVISPAVLRLINRALSDEEHMKDISPKDRGVVLLSRTNHIGQYVQKAGANSIDGFEDHVRTFFPEHLRRKITVSTSHGYKGLQKRVVIILDALARRYPLIHPHWVFTSILGDNPTKLTEEDRRLFYVALTRAIDELIIVTDTANKSPFLEEVLRSHQIGSLNWADVPELPQFEAEIVVHVGSQDGRGSSPTYEIKDQLRAHGYRYQTVGWGKWVKSFPEDSFDLNRIKAELWAQEADGVEVRVQQRDTLLRAYYVDKGKWREREAALPAIS